jgi:SpoVK/Ycf46/Vps4 family AAA+-type ATPase
VIRDRIRDEAIAIAKAYSHPTVEPRHVLWGIVVALGPAAPTEVSAATVKALLEPHGTSYQTPVVSSAAEAVLATIIDDASAVTAAIALLKKIQDGDTGDAGPAATHTPTPTTPTMADTDSSASATASSRAAATSETPPPAKSETTDSILAELDALVGLASVKAAVRRLIAVQTLNAERKATGLPTVNESLHVVFTGAPGTGKTTIARIIARLYGSIGVVSRGQLVEVSRADLVAGYVGQTALKVQEVVGRALGGVLFIDEAYSLAEEGSGEFGAEAIAMLVKLMEDHRDDLAVIVAGYPEQMRQFIDSNPGLRSRFTHYIDFPDYTAPELVEVFEGFATESKVSLGKGVGARLEQLFALALNIGNFGNARYARSLFEQSYANLASRAMADGHIDPGEGDEILVEDLPPADPFTTAVHKIGFQAR